MDSPLPPQHFVGIAGSGMSALALYAAKSGRVVSGSDRAFDRGQLKELRQSFEAEGVQIHPQDGSGVRAGQEIVTSTAVEAHIADLERAHALGLAIVHRSTVLARALAGKPSVAIAGTSGKSTTTAMLYWILLETGRDPGLLGGAALCGRGEPGAPGQNAVLGRGPLIAEADESDGTLVHYAPAIGVVMNWTKDHAPKISVEEQFQRFLTQSREHRLIQDCASLVALCPQAKTLGESSRADFPLELRPAPLGWAAGCLSGEPFSVPMPGAHNAWNAGFAIASASLLGCPLPEAADALARFPGVARRFEGIGTAHGLRFFDDYAHNPDKLAAAIRAASAFGPRTIAVWQPHGFGPLRLFLQDLKEAFLLSLRPADQLVLLPVHDAGGTARRDISAEDLSRPIDDAGRAATALWHRDALPDWLHRHARAGDVVLIMGARDATLGGYAREVFARFSASP